MARNRKGKEHMAKGNGSMSVQEIPVADITADVSWNARSGKWEDDEDQKTGEGFKALVEDIRENGVEDPIEVRPNPKHGKKGETPFLLVAGFRRLKAATAVGLETIPAVVKDYSESGARRRNLAENIDRQNLRPADIAFGIGELLQDPEYAALGDAELGKRIGLGQSYTNHLKAIITTLPKAVTKAWRETPVKLRVNEDMYPLLKLKTKEEQVKEFEKLLAGRSTAQTPKQKASKALKAIKERCHEMGRKLGNMAQLGAIEVNDDADWEKVAELVLKVRGNDKVKAKRLVAAATALGVGYTEGYKEDLTPKADEPEDDDTGDEASA